MEWINDTDLNAWADQPQCEGELPIVVRRLILATVDRVSRIDFPGGAGVNLPGWDGRLNVTVGNGFVPDGVSVWEMSRRKDISEKADEDYQKRTKDPDGVDPQTAVFVFVTPRVWGGRDKWIAQKQEEKRWRDVRAFDARNLAQWIDTAPATGSWLARKLGKAPVSGVLSLDEFWEEWSDATKPPLTAELVLAGRREHVDHVARWAQAAPSQFYVQADTRDEGVAFLAACAQTAMGDWGGDLFARGLICQTEESWRHLARQRSPLVLVLDFDGSASPSIAVRSGHHVLVPVGKADSITGAGVVLMRLARDEFVRALREMGLREDDGRSLARTTGRNMTVLRRRLIDRAGGPRPAWATPPVARSLIPALLIGQWSEASSDDCAMLEKIAAVPHAELLAQYTTLLGMPDAPLRKIGPRWRLTSHEEAWELLAPYLIQSDLNRFRETAVDLLSQASPAYDLEPDERYMAGIKGKVLTQSEIIPVGVTETLALMGSRPEAAANSPNVDSLAAQIVSRVLERGNDWRLWATLGSDLSTLAEAAPEGVLSRVEEALTQTPSPFATLFKQEGDGVFGGCPHAGLLWALERLAWSRDHFARVSLALAHLATIDPGGQHSNRPRESLRGLFLPWIRQSAASDADRLVTLDSLLERLPEVGWRLLIDVSPRRGTITGRTPPEWRTWVQDAKPMPTRDECIAFIKAIVDRMLQHVNGDPRRWADILDVVAGFSREQRNEAISKLEADAIGFENKEGSLEPWSKLRDLLHHHRGFPDAEWAMPSEELDRLAAVYARLEPEDPITAWAWLFEAWPHLPSGERRDHKAYENLIQDERNAVLARLITDNGMRSVLDLAQQAPAPHAVGWSFALVTERDEQAIDIIVASLGDEHRSLREFARSACASLHNKDGWDALDDIISRAKARGTVPGDIADVYHAAPATRGTWERLERERAEIQHAYWSTFHNIYRIDIDDSGAAIYVSQKLLDIGRPVPVVELLSSTKAKLPSSLMVQALEELPRALMSRSDSGQKVQLQSYYIAAAFKKLDAAEDVSCQTIARLEIPFVGVLEHDRPTLALHRDVTEDPTTFADLISWAFKPSDDRVEIEELDKEQRTRRAEVAWNVLYHIRRIPGLKDSSEVTEEKLFHWVEEARKLCSERGRGDIGDEMIGRLLANSPVGSDGAWPCEAVREVLERYKGKHLGLGFRIGKRNLRGVTFRGVFEGGEQERDVAAKFQQDANKITARWPFTGGLLQSLAKDYEHDARSEDQDADWRDLEG
jgi:hypothetical protein